MRWTPGGIGSDVEDRRGQSGFGGMGGGGIGCVGLIILIVISLITGRNYVGAFLSGSGGQMQQVGPSAPPRSASPQEDRSAQLASFVATDTQNTWTKILADENVRYPRAKVVLFRDYTQSGCGVAQSATGPFYCPADMKVYLDLGFWDQLRSFGASGDFAQAYVVAHEIGHHVQNVLGIERQVRALQRQNPRAQNQLSVMMELQADCFAGVWAHSTADRHLIDQSDVKSGLDAAASVGDDRIQKMSRGYVSPESFTHGSSEQRVSWFNRGLKSGDPNQCNTFGTKDDNPRGSY